MNKNQIINRFMREIAKDIEMFHVITFVTFIVSTLCQAIDEFVSPDYLDTYIRKELHDLNVGVGMNEKKLEGRKYNSDEFEKMFKIDAYDSSPIEGFNKEQISSEPEESQKQITSDENKGFQRSETFNAYNISEEVKSTPTTGVEKVIDIIKETEIKKGIIDPDDNDDIEVKKTKYAKASVPLKDNTENVLNSETMNGFNVTGNSETISDVKLRSGPEAISNTRNVLKPKFLKIDDNSGSPVFSVVEKGSDILSSNPHPVVFAEPIVSNGPNLVLTQIGLKIPIISDSDEQFKHPNDFSKSTFVGVPMFKLLNMLRTGAKADNGLSISRISRSQDLSSSVMNYIRASARNVGDIIYTHS